MKTQRTCYLALAGILWLSAGVQATTTTEPLRIMPLGDSITCGTYPGGYRTKLWSDLASAHYTVDFVGASASNPDPVNLPDPDHNGYGGWRIEQLDADVVGWMDASKPAAVLLHVGTNDVAQNYDFGDISTRLSHLIKDITTQSPQTHLIVAQIIPILDSASESRVQAYNSLVSDVVASHAANGELVTLVDMHSVLTTSDLSDGVHPTKAGYDMMGNAWFNAIKSLGPIGNPIETPEPCSAILSLLGLIGLGVYAWWRQK